jgi:hypothetical protein
MLPFGKQQDISGFLTRNPEELPGNRRDFFAYHNDRVDYLRNHLSCGQADIAVAGRKYLIG